MDHKTIEAYLLSLPGAWLDYPFGEGVAVYKVGHNDVPRQDEKMFALISEGTKPLRISLKCDPQLAVHLRENMKRSCRAIISIRSTGIRSSARVNSAMMKYEILRTSVISW